MGIDEAIEQLRETGWSSLDTSGHEYSPTGQLHPSVERVRAAFEEAGRRLEVKRAELFDCYRAEWTATDGGGVEGSVVGQTAAEAAVYALATFRRGLRPAVAGAAAG